MAAQARLTPPALEIAAGESANVEVAVRNTGTATDSFRVEVVQGPSWLSLTPATLSLLPYEERSLTVALAPPRSADVTAGSHPYAIRVTAVSDAVERVTVGGSVTVGAYTEVGLELTPHTLTGSVAGRAQVTVTNRSNVRFRGDLSGRDPEQALGLAFHPASVDLGPGDVVTAGLSVRPRHRFLRGAPVSRPFTVVVTETSPADADFYAEGAPRALRDFADLADPADGAPEPEPPSTSLLPVPTAAPVEVTAAGTLVQSAMAPDRTLPVLAVVAVIVVVAVIGWFALVKPQIHDAVRSQVRQELSAAGVTSSPTGRSGTAAAGSGVSVSGPASIRGALTVNGSLLAAGNGTQSYTVPAGKDLEISDLLVQNAAGDSGIVALAQGSKVLMQWSLANFRDLDYHWVTPIVIGPGLDLELQTSGCTDTCTPGLYYAGALVPAGS